MAKTVVTQEMIEEINTLFLKIGTYAGVSRAMGGTPSATTVKKYIIPNFTPREALKKKEFNTPISEIPDYEPFKLMENWGDLCVLSDDEYDEVEKLWEELVL